MHTSRNALQVRTPREVREEFARRGLSISSWARQNGYSAPLVYQVLSGKNRGMRGQSHDIAVQLGLKAGLVGSSLHPELLFPISTTAELPGNAIAGSEDSKAA